MRSGNERFGYEDLDPAEEERWKRDTFDLSMDPREWMTRKGHNILVGYFRMFCFTDKEFESWIHVAFEALENEGLEKL